MKYLNLHKVVKELAACNELTLTPIDQWPLIQPKYSLYILERQAARIPEGDINTFIDGDADQINALTYMYKAESLCEFLNDVFNHNIKIMY